MIDIAIFVAGFSTGAVMKWLWTRRQYSLVVLAGILGANIVLLLIAAAEA